MREREPRSNLTPKHETGAPLTRPQLDDVSTPYLRPFKAQAHRADGGIAEKLDGARKPRAGILERRAGHEGDEDEEEGEFEPRKGGRATGEGIARADYELRQAAEMSRRGQSALRVTKCQIARAI